MIVLVFKAIPSTLRNTLNILLRVSSNVLLFAVDKHSVNYIQMPVPPSPESARLIWRNCFNWLQADPGCNDK